MSHPDPRVTSSPVVESITVPKETWDALRQKAKRAEAERDHYAGLMRSADDAAIEAGVHTGENLPSHVYIATLAQQAKLLKAGREAAESVMLDLQRECVALRKQLSAAESIAAAWEAESCIRGDDEARAARAATYAGCAAGLRAALRDDGETP